MRPFRTIIIIAIAIIAGVVAPAPAPAGATQPGSASGGVPGRGSARSLIRALDVHLGAATHLAVVESRSQATLDAVRAGAPQNRVYRELVAARLGDVTVPSEPWVLEAGDASEGDAVQDTAPLEVDVPGLVEATLTPSRVKGSFRRGLGGSVHAALNVGSVRLLDGLVELRDVGPGEIGGATSTDANSSSTRGLEMGDVTLLDLDALLEVAGLGGLERLLPTRLARLADRMRLDVSTGSFGSWTAALDALEDVRAELAADATAGLGCLGLAPSLRSRLAELRDALGERPVECLAGVLVSDLVRDLDDVLARLVEAMRSGLASRALLTLTGVGGTTEASASVSPSGEPEGTAAAWGRVGSVLVGGEDVGGFATDAAEAALDTLEHAVDDALSEVTSALGDGFEDLVRVDVLPAHTRRLQVHDDYVTTSAEVALFAVHVTPPRIGSAARGDGGAVDLSHALPASTASSSPPPQPVSIVLGSLSSHAEHTRPGVDLGCTGVCDLPSDCDGAACRVPRDSSTGTANGPGDGTPELPRTGGGSLLLTGGALVAAALYGRARASAWSNRTR